MTTMMDTEPDTETRVLTAHDRCDAPKCNAQAYYMTVFDSGELVWCIHHYIKHSQKLNELAYHIVDQSKDLS